jgi:molybdenum cofactor cytidylyltransferase
MTSGLPTSPAIPAIVAAAGRSLRMGTPKQLLPWGATTVLGATVANLVAAGAAPVICVVGHDRAAVAATLEGLPARIVENAHYLEGEMLSSYQAGIRFLEQDLELRITGTLLALGDQPQIPARVIGQVIAQARALPSAIVVPSFNRRRGHPFYLPRQLFADLLGLTYEESLRVLMHRHAAAITYVEVDTEAILRDIDTPADYQALTGSGT